MATRKFADSTGLTEFWAKVKALIPDGSSFTPVYSSNLNNFDTTYPKVSIYYTDGESLNTPYKAGLTDAQKGICISFSVTGYWTQVFTPYAGDKSYQRYGTPPSYVSDWKALGGGGSVLTVYNDDGTSYIVDGDASAYSS